MFTRMYCAEQIYVPPDLPHILKAFSKAIIFEKPKDIIDFSVKYFKKQLENPPNSSSGYRVTVEELHGLQVELTGVMAQQPELRRVDYQVAANKLSFSQEILTNILRLGFADKDIIDLYIFMGIGASLVSTTLKQTMVNLFKIFEDEQCQSKLPTASLIRFIEFLMTKDPTISADTIQKIKDGAPGDFIDFVTYKRIFDSDE